jgi:hypothetical protein
MDACVAISPERVCRRKEDARGCKDRVVDEFSANGTAQSSISKSHEVAPEMILRSTNQKWRTRNLEKSERVVNGAVREFQGGAQCSLA